MAILILFPLTASATINILYMNDECAIYASDSRITGDFNYISSDSFEKLTKVSKYAIARIQGKMSIKDRHFKAFISDFKGNYGINNESEIYIDSIRVLFDQYIDSLEIRNNCDFSGSIGFAGLSSMNRFTSYSYYDRNFNFKEDSCRVHGYYMKAWGTTFAYNRIIFGVDSILLSYLNKDLEMLPPDSLRKPIIGLIKAHLDSTSLALNISSIEDAINFVYTLTKSSIEIDNACQGRYYKNDFIPYYPSLGGDVLMLIVTREGAKWIKPPDYCVDQ